MTIRKWFYLFWTTTLLGSIISLVLGLFLQLTDNEYNQVNLAQLGYSVVFMLIGGAMISVLSQMGFFAYMIVKYFASGVFRKKIIWDYIQMILILVVLFDSVYYRRNAWGNSISFGGYLIDLLLPLIILILSLCIAYWKVKLTNLQAFIPTLFFMFVVTILEAVPAIKLNNSVSSIYMLFPLFICNSWQILILSKVLQNHQKV